MEVKQVYQLVNSITSEILGDTAVLNEDLSNVVDVGEAVFNAGQVDAYVKSLVNHIGKVVFVNRVYSGNAPSVLMDGWEFGSVLEKIRAKMPEAQENESWELQDGQSYDPNIFVKPEVSAKFYNKKVTFEIQLSYTEMQVKQSFSNAAQLNGFISMLFNEVDKSLTVKIDELIMRTINSMTAETIHDDYGSTAISRMSGIKAVNLLYLYKTQFGVSLTPSDAMTSPDFIRFAILEMKKYIPRLRKMSKLFNVGGTDKFTPTDALHVVMLSDFKQASDVYLQSSTFHDEYTQLMNADEVPYWQGSGLGYDFASVSKIHVKTANNNTVEASGILAVMFDRDALGVANLDRRVTTNYNAKAEFYNNFYKFEAGYFNDLDENFVVFLVA